VELVCRTGDIADGRAERRRGLPHRLRPQRPAVGLRPDVRRLRQRLRQDIAIVDAYDDPNAESDLANAHDSQALMPEQPSDTPSLRFVSDEQQVEFR
jgi:hypothetical protein